MQTGSRNCCLSLAERAEALQGCPLTLIIIIVRAKREILQYMICQRIHTVSSAPSLFVQIFFTVQLFCERATKVRIILCETAD